ncbi:CoA transferase subunit A [Diaphorobacter sp. HDW4A]|uniref:CoA transferase subunit A n=1 Tax=Diaphorobacter sp. HDW4A TaxID=2714924 RepID=UPI00140CC99C|nr:CoA transferase subunit A [Diaphorobacter sp. HDW4A]QIL80352.1 CoA transferase subunit A [Diaphorobacter sp. HDW4A]
MVNKVMSAKDVVASIQDGMTIGIGGWGPRRKPMALVRELLRSDVKDLTVVSYGGADVGMLCAAGKVKKLIFAFVTLDFIPLEPYFRKARQNGDIEVVEVDEGQMLLGLKAAAMRVPYIPTRIGLGTDLVKHNPQIKVIDSPYDSKEWVAMPALNLDVALLHVDKADARGVCQISGPDMYMDDLYARAAKKTFVSCDELVETSAFDSAENSRLVFWERSETTGVVHLPCGAHPTSCGPAYGFDTKHFKEYATGAKEESGWSDYVAKYVNCTEQEYLDKVGGADAIKRLPLPVF